MPPLVKLLVLHSHTLFCEKFIEILKRTNGISEVRYATCGSAALKLLNEINFQILFLHDMLEDAEILQFIRKVKTKFGSISIILFTMNKDLEYLKKMKRAGVKGFVHVSAKGKVIKICLESIAAGNSHYCPVYSNIISGDFEELVFEKIDPKTLFGFTNKEYDVFKLKVIRSSIAQIMKAMNWSESTAKEYSSYVLNKVRDKNYKDEMDFYLQTGWSEL